MRCKFPSPNSALMKSLNQSTKIHASLTQTKQQQYDPKDIIHTLVSKYNTSQNYFYQRIINSAFNSKFSKNNLEKNTCNWLINIKNQEPNDGQQHLEKYYNFKQINKELPSLFQYYKYYGQTSMIFFENYFKVMLAHQQRQKVVVYKHLKKVLSLQSQQDDTTQKHHGSKLAFVSTKILKNLSQSKILTQQSQFINELQLCLSHALGKDQPKSIKQIDQFYQKNKKVINSKSIFHKYVHTKNHPQTAYKKQRKHNANKSTNKTSLNKQSLEKSPQLFKKHKKNLSLLNHPNQLTAVNLHHLNLKNFSIKQKQNIGRPSQLRHNRYKSNESLTSSKIDPTFLLTLENMNSGKKCLKKNKNKSQAKVTKEDSYQGSIKNDILLIKAKIRKQKQKFKEQERVFGNTQFLNQRRRRVVKF